MPTEKVVVITGASSGIGRAAAYRFAQEGANLVITYRSNADGANEVVDQVQKHGGQCTAVRVDVADELSVSHLWDTVERQFGTVDILINNAGLSGGEPFLTAEMSHWLNAFNVNFFGAVRCSQRAARMMVKNRAGKIINISSIRGLPHAGREGVMAYSAAKAALNNFTLTLAKELAPHVQVNAVAPGFVYTPYYDTLDESVRAKFVEGSLIKRFVTPDEIADGILFLAKSDAVTGQILTMDGGYTLIKG